MIPFNKNSKESRLKDSIQIFKFTDYNSILFGENLTYHHVFEDKSTVFISFETL